MHEVTYLGTPTHPRTPAARFSSTHFPLRRRHNHFAPRLGRVLSKRRHFMLDDAFIFTITAFPWPNHCEFNSRDADVAGGWRKPSNRKSTPSVLPLAAAIGSCQPPLLVSPDLWRRTFFSMPSVECAPSGKNCRPAAVKAFYVFRP